MDSLVQDLAYYADALTNMSIPAHREKSSTIFRHKLIETLSFAGSFDFPLHSIEWCQILTPSDSTFRLITWELKVSDNEFKYFGLIQKFDGSIIELHDKRPLRSEYASFDQNTWYGALYYGIEEFKNELGESVYLILGFNAGSGSSNTKVADVLQFVDDGVRFGTESFVVPGDNKTDDVKSRILMEYASSASGRMQFDREKNMLIYDHVILINAGFEGPLWVPDGSFHGFEYKDGKWHFIDKVFHKTVDRPPGEGLDNNDGDIMGRKKN